MRHVCEERKRHRGCARKGAEGGEETEETWSRSEGASQLAHTSPLERPREGKRGPGTGNLLLYTRPEIRMYHSRTHVGARARAHERPVVGLIHTGPIVKTTMESSYDESRFTISGYSDLTLAHLCERSPNAISNDRSQRSKRCVTGSPDSGDGV